MILLGSGSSQLDLNGETLGRSASPLPSATVGGNPCLGVGMAKRKGVSASLRWSVFARDGFMCRYCGAQAGQDGVDLVADHVVSVNDGGDNSFDNLVTACRKCNGGKGARSLQDAPTSQEVIARIDERTTNLYDQAEAMRKQMDARKELSQEAVNLKCEAYGVESVRMRDNEGARIVALCRTHGADMVSEWHSTAASMDVPEWEAIKYVHGIIRKRREAGEQ